MKHRKYGYLAPVFAFCLVIAFSLPAEEQPADSGDSQSEAQAILLDMAEYLAQLQKFEVTILSGYDAVQADGQKIEFNSKRKVLVNRPDQLRVDVEKSDGNSNLTLIDGKNITVSSTSGNVYAQASSPGNLDAAVKYLVSELNIRLPLALLFLTTLPGELEQRIQVVDYVEETTILGVTSHHLAGRTQSVDFQIWVKDGDEPLPLRIILTYRLEEGLPQFRALFTDWNVSPKVSKSAFTFKPADGATKISFLSQLNQLKKSGEEP